MASEKLSRENVAAEEQKAHVEGDRVPKMATHFESLSGHGSAVPGGVTEEREIRRETVPGKSEGEYREEGEGGERKGLSNEEISGYRQQAQQGSIDALRAAEERYNQAKSTAASTLQSVKDTVLEKGAHAKDTLLGKGTETTESVGQKSGEVKDTALEKITQAKDTLAQKGTETKDTVLEKGTEAKDTVLEKGTQAKDTVLEKGTQAKDTVLEKGTQAKETVLEKGTQAKDTLAQKAVEAKEGTTTVAEKAKEAAVKAAVEVKDRAAVAGWTTAHYMTDLTVEGTKKSADMAKGVAGYVGEKVGVVKDKVVETEESARDYAARKKEEAQRELEAKKIGQHKEGMGAQGAGGGERSMVEEMVQKPKETVGELFQGGGGQQQDEGGNGGGVLQAIGETIAEIAQTTKHLVIGQDETNQGGKKTEVMDQYKK